MAVASTPQEPAALAHALGDRLVVRRAIALPAVCMKCGADDRVIVRNERSFWFVAPWLYALLVLGPFGALGLLALTKTASLGVPLCADCDARWNRAASLRTMVTSVAVASMLAAIFLPLLAPARGMAASMVVGVLGSAAIVVAFLSTASRLVKATSIDAQWITLAGVEASARARVCSDATPAPELPARPTIRLAGRLLVAHLLAYVLAFAWTVAAIAIVIRTLPTDLDPDMPTVAPLVLGRVAWPFVGVWVCVHLASLPWVLTRDATRLKWTRALFIVIAAGVFVGALAAGGVAWSRLLWP